MIDPDMHLDKAYPNMRIILLLKKLCLALLTLCIIMKPGFAVQRSIALTIDDLPFVGESKNAHLERIIQALTSNKVPATGFIIAGEVRADNWPMLQKFRDSGFGLGNHTLTHANLNKMTVEAYIQEIQKSDKILSSVLTKPKYFRFPYLVEGQGSKKEKIMHYLFSKNYRIAPITIDSKDFIFNQLLLSVPEKERRFFLNVLKPCYIDFIWEQTKKAEEQQASGKKPQPPQILLIHANLLNAYVLPDIIQMYRENGYAFVSLKQALRPSQTSQNPRTIASRNPNDSQIETYMAWD